MATALARPLDPPRRGDLHYRIDGRVAEIIPIGPVADGFRLNTYVGGPVIAGELIGARMTLVDYCRIRHDGVSVVHAHGLVTVDDRVIAVRLQGLLLPPTGVDAPRPTDIVQPGFAWPQQPYTIHVSASLETAVPELTHLNTTVVAHTGTVHFATGHVRVDAHIIG